MDQEQSKQIMVAMAGTHSAAFNSLLTSILKKDLNRDFKTVTMMRRPPVNQVVWMLNRSVTL